MSTKNVTFCLFYESYQSILTKNHTEVSWNSNIQNVMLTSFASSAIKAPAQSRILRTRLNVSAESIRRDVRPLTESRTLVKVHGAVSLPHFFIEAPFERRMRENAAEKNRHRQTCREKN